MRVYGKERKKRERSMIGDLRDAGVSVKSGYEQDSKNLREI